MPDRTPDPALPVVALVGTTATGKSDLALDLTERLARSFAPAEVVNADAMQLYRGMDIGTAKLPVDERRGIAHHLLDVLEVTDEASVAAYQRDAREAIAQIRADHRIPLLVGGSGLYVRAALDRLEIPPTDPAVRAGYQEQLASGGIERLYALLRERDPVAAAAIEPRNGRRIVRALEVIELTGRPFSASMPRKEYVTATVQLGVRREREELDARIEVRARRMWETGLVDEVRSLESRGLRDGATAARAIGYDQALAQLDGRMSEEEAIAATAAATRRLVRRQESWFGSDARITWFDASDRRVVDRLHEAVAAAVHEADPLMHENGTHD
ncbi:tRNA (adenosine(37)-N6)-dimethylallyltransferase MiaA [Nostocoides sp. F2B08]|uniref:tRNA (adenosine(37)-N6)-dimethylallyltransferase MiaA n=1 Tax=Nostocoides sp. F2B08 TaxID=2653936 RepID=UPI001262F9B5|nr:tRNA (adenosine(37)-N6)-dimethylallyltransferase MiaA [Tetrasphaera sp. F2B08]KAB7744773.1 tRNA (adenosine(37)-N6)-dimethylallyltransferase MiaA [Tetrasphaera sp. F2B08]